MDAAMRFACVVALVGFLVCLTTSSAIAQSADEATRSAARTLGYSGVEAYQAGRYASASEQLEKAYQVLKVPSLGLWSARALVKLGKLVQASERYLEVKHLAAAGGDEPVQAKAKADAEVEWEELSRRIPRLLIRVRGGDGRDVKVTIDGVGVPSELIRSGHPLDPGHHSIAGKRGNDEVTVDVTLAEAEQNTIVLDLPANEPGGASVASRGDLSTRGSGRRRLGWWIGGAGAVGLVVGSATGLMVFANKKDIERDCPNRLCNAAGSETVDSTKTLSTASTVSFILGAAGVALGGYFVITSSDEVAVGASGLSWQRRF